MYEYKEEDLENIKSLRAIIEFMLREHYIRVYADTMMNYYSTINVVLLFSSAPPWIQWISSRVTFWFNDWHNRWYLDVLKEVTTSRFWQRLRKNNCLLDGSKTDSERYLYLRDRDIWYVSKYIKQNVLVRNVKLFQ